MEIKYDLLRSHTQENLFNLGKSYTDLSTEIGCGLVQVSSFMNGYQNIGKKYIPLICKYLGLNIKDYYTID